jgi:hypothetical protein
LDHGDGWRTLELELKKGFLEQGGGMVLGEGEQRRGVVAFRSFVDQIMELRWGSGTGVGVVYKEWGRW